MEPRDLIEDIDARQTDLLIRLAELNARVETLMNQWMAARDPSAALGPSPAAPTESKEESRGFARKVPSPHELAPKNVT